MALGHRIARARWESWWKASTSLESGVFVPHWTYRFRWNWVYLFANWRTPWMISQHALISFWLACWSLGVCPGTSVWKLWAGSETPSFPPYSCSWISGGRVLMPWLWIIATDSDQTVDFPECALCSPSPPCSLSQSYTCAPPKIGTDQWWVEKDGIFLRTISKGWPRTRSSSKPLQVVHF